MLTIMLVVGVPVLTAIQVNGASDKNVSLLLRLTAWTSFLVYLLVFVTRPLNQLRDSRLTRTMLRNRRLFGIALAVTHSVHLVLIVMYVLDPSNLPPTLAVGGIAYALLYLMLITSFNAPAAAIGPVAWRRLHKTGLYWIGGTFTFTLISNFLSEPNNVFFLALTILLLITIGIRIAAFRTRKKG